MKLIQLRYLVAVAENDLSITQAARAIAANTQDGVDQEFAAVKIPFQR